MSNLAEFKNKSQEQMVEYAVRMRKRAESAERRAAELEDALWEKRHEIARMTNHIHDLTGDGTGWWECACGYRVSSNHEQREAELERERDSARKRIQEMLRFFREVHGRLYFDGHEFSEHHGMVYLNEAGTRLLNWGDD